MQKSLLNILVFLVCLASVFGQPSISPAPQPNVAITDTIGVQQVDTFVLPTSSKFPLLDSLRKPERMRQFIFPYEAIRHLAPEKVEEFSHRDLPGVKEIGFRKKKDRNWKFFVLAAILIFVAILRLMNIRRFDETLSIAFDTTTDIRIYLERGVDSVITGIGIFIAYLASLALFLVSYAENRRMLDTLSNSELFFKVFFTLILIYLGKMLIQLFISSVFKVRQFGQLFLLNTLSTSNLAGLVLIFFNLLYIYVPTAESAMLIGDFALIVLLVTIVFRLLKDVLMGLSVQGYPFLYLFIYLCALEILPFLVVFKLYLNTWFN
ncbi:MAG: DUF4271 domain-containing protein [Bacteroidia bacterium]|nr:DUF4271 domain-containing protein [Bacteroidia bacterium]